MTSQAAPPRKRGAITGPILLLGEGIDEENALGVLCTEWALSRFAVDSYGGKHAAKGFLSTLQLRDGYEQLEVVIVTRDANGDASAAFDSACDALRQHNLPVPNAVAEYAVGARMRAAVYVFPGEGAAGALEDLVLRTIPDEESRCIDAFFACGEAAGAAPRQIQKARIQAWLALRADTVGSLGIAFKKGLIDVSHEAFVPFRDFLLQA